MDGKEWNILIIINLGCTSYRLLPHKSSAFFGVFFFACEAQSCVTLCGVFCMKQV